AGCNAVNEPTAKAAATTAIGKAARFMNLPLCYTFAPMMTRSAIAAAVAITVQFGLHAQSAHDQASLDRFLTAPSAAEASGRVEPVLQSGLSFDDVYKRLKQGREY